MFAKIYVPEPSGCPHRKGRERERKEKKKKKKKKVRKERIREGGKSRKRGQAKGALFFNFFLMIFFAPSLSIEQDAEEAPVTGKVKWHGHAFAAVQG